MNVVEGFPEEGETPPLVKVGIAPITIQTTLIITNTIPIPLTTFLFTIFSPHAYLNHNYPLTITLKAIMPYNESNIIRTHYINNFSEKSQLEAV
ncbi:MAG: hypothetical protein KKG76_04670 [Euryarchaeota archaeon]|nr:hypothetical protein [Euryarchaeota archaeon]MBU4139973.1 hypothetical protein [Euryarchaeota archaeon]